MIKFFRNIRRQLLGEGNLGRYIKYAVGEILLVMIGILLALQVNNWNEERKALRSEIKLVKQLLEDAKADSVFFESRISLQKERDTLFNDLINFSNGISVDSISRRKVNYNPFFFRLAYQSNLIHNNPEAYDLVSNDSIKAKLRDYSAKYDYVVHSIELSNRIAENYGVPMKIKFHKELNKITEDPIIENFKFILEDETTIATLEQFKENGINYLFQLERFLDTNQELIIHLETYLETNQ